MGRWHGVRREDRVYIYIYARIDCDSGEIKDVRHSLVQCSAWDCLKQALLKAMEAEM